MARDIGTDMGALESGMSDEELVAILITEEADASSYYTSELAQDQATAMERFYAAPYGDEVDGRSKITTHDIQDTINWIMPSLMRLFFGADELVSCEPENENDEPNCQPAASYLEHILLRDNPGTTLIYDFCFDGLVQRLGVMSVLWVDAKPGIPKVFSGMGADQLMAMHSDPEWEILAAAPDGEVDADDNDNDDEPSDPSESAGSAGTQQQPAPGAPDTAQQPQPSAAGAADQPASEVQPAAEPQIITFTIRARRTPKIGRVKLQGVPPEEIALSRRARSIDEADYIRRKQLRYLADVVRENPKKKGDLGYDAAPSSRDDSSDTDARVMARFQNESISIGNTEQKTGSRKKVDYITEWLWVDYDGDGEVELRRIERVGNVVLSNEAVDRCELVSWSPIRVAHKAIGLSLADTIIDLQKIRTVITRKILDSLSQSLTPRNAMNMQMCDEQAVDDILDAVVGGVVRVNGNVEQAIKPLTSPDVTEPGMQALEYFDQKSEQASGVTRHSQGLQPDAITKTAAGIENLQAAAGERTEMIANWLGLAIESILQRVLTLLVDHQEGERWLKLSGRDLRVDPRLWSDEMAIKVHIGKVGTSRQQQLTNLSAIAAKQEEAIKMSGPDNPVTSIEKLLHTYSRMTEAMGFKDSGKFWKTAKESQQTLQAAAAKPPAPDPKVAEMQQKSELAQAALQAKTQADSAAAQAKAQQAERDSAIELQIALKKLSEETQLALIRLREETALARERMIIEAETARHVTSTRIPEGPPLTDGVRVGGAVG